MNPDSNNLNFDSDEEIDDTINDVLDELKIKFAESRMLQIILENMEACNRELAAENRELKLSLESINGHADLREELNEALRAKLKYLKENHARMTAYKSKSFKELTSEFSSQLALHCVANLPSQQAQPRPQLPMPPSTSDQPHNEQPDPKVSDFNPKN